MIFAARWRLFTLLMAPAWAYEAILAWALAIRVTKTMSARVEIEDDTHHA